jgi:hypothetical protein
MIFPSPRDYENRRPEYYKGEVNLVISAIKEEI